MLDKKDDKKNNAAMEQLKRSFNAVAATPDGRAVLRHIMKDCGFKKSSAVMNPATYEINTVGTIWNEARKDVYIGLRNFIDNEHLIAIEFTED